MGVQSDKMLLDVDWALDCLRDRFAEESCECEYACTCQRDAMERIESARRLTKAHAATDAALEARIAELEGACEAVAQRCSIEVPNRRSVFTARQWEAVVLCLLVMGHITPRAEKEPNKPKGKTRTVYDSEGFADPTRN